MNMILTIATIYLTVVKTITRMRKDTVSHGSIKRLRPRQKWPPFPDDIFNCIFFIENKFRLTFHWSLFSSVPITLCNALVQIPSRPGDKRLSEPMLVSLLADICVTTNRTTAKYRAYHIGYIVANWQNYTASSKPTLIFVELLLKRRWKQICNFVSLIVSIKPRSDLNTSHLQSDTRAVYL